MEDIKQQVGAMIREARKAQGLTQQELAQQVNTSEARISQIENGKINLTLDTIENILRALNVKLSMSTNK